MNILAPIINSSDIVILNLNEYNSTLWSCETALEKFSSSMASAYREKENIINRVCPGEINMEMQV